MERWRPTCGCPAPAGAPSPGAEATVGLVLGGIVGAFFAVPMLAALVAVAKLHRRQRAEEALMIPGSPAAARQAPPGMEPAVPGTADALGAPGALPGSPAGG